MSQEPIIIAGPCLAESYEMLDEVLSFLMQKLRGKTDFYFKASFDKANRTSSKNPRGEGLEKTMTWFSDLKAKYKCKIITDIHETTQVKEVSQICDALQIPAFLCRQTDLLLAACETGRLVNIKKGQFMAPLAMGPILDKARAHCQTQGLSAPNLALTERGASFGYGDLVVDVRSFPWMSSLNVPVIFDITHSTQRPPMGGGSSFSSGCRSVAPALARAAAASGYVSGFFLEIHPNPKIAKSDASTQLSIKQGEALLDQILPIWKQSHSWSMIDSDFHDS